MIRILARRSSVSARSRTRKLCLGVLPDTLDRGSESFATNSNVMEGLISQLHSHIHLVMNGGGREAVTRKRSRNKLLPRERIDRLIDPSSAFLELSQLAGHELYEEPLPSGGIITGVGPVHGKLCIFVVNDPTVKGGTYYPITVKKHLGAQEIATKCRLPLHVSCRQRRCFPSKASLGLS